MRKLGLIAMKTFAGVFATSAQTTSEKVPEKTRELNEVTIVKTKKRLSKKQIALFLILQINPI